MYLLYSVVEVMIFFKLSAKPTSVSNWFVGEVKQKRTGTPKGSSLKPLPPHSGGVRGAENSINIFEVLDSFTLLLSNLKLKENLLLF